jgi:citrate lyase beta subunit
MARDLVAEATRAKGFGAREVAIRINGLDTEWGEADLVAAAQAGPDAILIPKVNSAADIATVRTKMEAAGAPQQTTLWAMMETPLGILNAQEIAAADRMTCFILGTNDLVKDLHAAHTPERTPLITSLSICLLAARAYGLACIDGVYNAFKDDDGLRSACQQGKDMGFDGKTLIHPAQLAIANEVFGPSADELKLAARYVEAFETAGGGVAVVDGRIVENLHVENAQRLLAEAAAIQALEASVT